MIDQAVYGEDVEPGDEIGPLVKHPDTEQVRAFLNVWNPRGMAEATPGQGAPMNRFLQGEGTGGPMLPGSMSQALLSQLLTDWAGSAGRLRTLDVNFRRPVRHGEDLKCTGLVTDKHDEGNETVVHVDVFIEDPRGDRPVQGVAEVVIPAKR